MNVLIFQDMAPRYMADRRMGTTHYKTNYDADKVSSYMKTSRIW